MSISFMKESICIFKYLLQYIFKYAIIKKININTMLRQILIGTFFFFLFSTYSVFADQKDVSSSDPSSHTGNQHPPHDHHDTDHLKHIRGHGQKKQKNLQKKIPS